MSEPQFRRSSTCSGGNCVEVAKDDDRYLIRNSRHPEIAPLSVGPDEWLAFVAEIKAGRFSFR